MYVEIIDNETPGRFALGGTWTTGPDPGGVGQTSFYTEPDAENARTAQWTSSPLPEGTYRVDADWTGNQFHPESTPWGFAIGGVLVQQTYPSERNASDGPDATPGGLRWQTVAEGLVVQAGQVMVVTMGSSPGGYATGDAVRIVQTYSPDPDPPADPPDDGPGVNVQGKALGGILPRAGKRGRGVRLFGPGGR